jgi:hypothetical protein
MTYYDKYIKYKAKYIELKNQFGCENCNLPTPTPTTQCIEVYAENITSGNPNGNSSIKFSYTNCSGNSQMTNSVNIGKGECVFTNNMNSISVVWIDNSTPPPVNGVDYKLTIDGCL